MLRNVFMRLPAVAPGRFSTVDPIYNFRSGKDIFMRSSRDELVVRGHDVNLYPMHAEVLDFRESPLSTEGIISVAFHHDGVSLSSKVPSPRNLLRVGGEHFSFSCSESGTTYVCESVTPVDLDVCYGSVRVNLYSPDGIFDVYFSGSCNVRASELAGYVFENHLVDCNSQRTVDGREVYVCSLEAVPSPGREIAGSVCEDVSRLKGVTLRKCDVSDNRIRITAVVDPEEAGLSVFGYDPGDYLLSGIVVDHYTEDDLADDLSRELGVPKDSISIGYGESTEYPFEDRWDVDIYIAGDEDLSEKNLLRALKRAEKVLGISLS